MIAAVLKDYNAFSLEEVDVEKPTGRQVQVEISYASICGTDMHIFKGDFHPRTPVPFIPGHEMAGTVAALGPDSGSFSVGDSVVIDPIIWCGECPACRTGHYPACTSLKLLGIDMDGGFCQYLNVDEGMLFKADAGIPMEHLALTELYGIGFHACNRAGVSPGDSIVIWGAGRVGQVILQAARTITRGKIFIVDVLDQRLKIPAKVYDDVFPINALHTDPVKEILRLTGDEGCEIAFEAVGHPLHPERTIQPVVGAIRSIRGGGKVCVLGLADEPVPIVFKELIWKEARIIASRVSHGEYPLVLDKLQENMLHPELLISEVFPARRIQEAFEVLEQDPEKYLKILVRFAGEASGA
jgi:threonine dehydrogenase-like Zn-dependent dehydrogenase